MARSSFPCTILKGVGANYDQQVGRIDEIGMGIEDEVCRRRFLYERGVAAARICCGLQFDSVCSSQCCFWKEERGEFLILLIVRRFMMMW